MKYFLPALVFCCTFTSQGQIITVSVNGTADFNNIQAAVNAAAAGDIVEIAQGVYQGTGNRDIDFQGKAITVKSIDPTNPDCVTATVIDCEGTFVSPHRGFRFHNGETLSSVVSGLTIINGYGPNEDVGYGPESHGGAIFCYGSGPLIEHCRIETCQARYGGAIYCHASSTEIRRCTVVGNSASATGGGISSRSGSSKVKNCIVADNHAYYGAGFDIIDDDLSETKGCIVVNNTATYRGGGIRVGGGNAIIGNCTFFGNSADSYGGGLYRQDAVLAVSNCIFWNNSPHQIYPSGIQVTYSDVSEGYAGQGNINVDPYFVNPATDYHLLEFSSCIDKGDPCYVAGPEDVDIDGQPRVVNQRIDMGADEFVSDVLPTLKVSPSEIEIYALFEDPAPASEYLTVQNIGGGTLNWQISEDCPWLTAFPSAGSCTAEANEVEIIADVNSLELGCYECVLTVYDDNAINSPQTVDVVLHVTEIPPSEFWRDYISFPSDPFESDVIFEDEPTWIKFTMVLAPPYDSNIVYFQDSRQYLFHYDFAADLLTPFIGLSRSEYEAVSLYQQEQQAALGAVIMSPDAEIAEYGIQFIRYDPYTREEIAEMFFSVKDSIVADPCAQAFYFPSYEQLDIALANSEWFEAQGMPVSSTARWANGNACYSPGWAIGRLKYFPTEQIAQAYTEGLLTSADILLTDAVPAEVPFVAGILCLQPSTPSSHVAILAQTFKIPFGHLAVASDASQAQQLIGRTILLCVGQSQDISSIGMKDVTEILTPVEIDEILALKAPPPLNIAPAAAYGKYSENTDILGPGDISHFGGKAANYGILRRSIPDNSPVAAALSFDLWNQFLDQPLTPAPGVIIPPGGRLIFWADDQTEQGPAHTSFKLSKGGEAVALFDVDGASLIDAVTFGEQQTDVSYGRSPDGNDFWTFFYGGDITPGLPNPGDGVSPADGLYINEIMADNDSVLADEYGQYDDWFEIYNSGPGPVDLGGMYLTDDLEDPTKFMISVGITGSTLCEEIANRLAGYTYPPDLQALAVDLAAIRNIIINAGITSFSPLLQDAVIAVLQDPNYGFDPQMNIRFRSSTNVEDSNQFSGAGLYDSYSGCLADDLDADDDGPCICDPEESSERGVFRAVRKVFASFYNDNAFLERLRYGIDENDVGMALLVHHSSPDQFELANGVAVLEKHSDDTNIYIKLVTQKGAVSVANPQDGSIPEQVSIVYMSQSQIEPTLVRSSNLVILGETVMNWPGDYNDFARFFAAAAQEFETGTGKTDYMLDFEYKKLLPGGSLPDGGLAVKQIRQIPPAEQTPEITTPFLINEPVTYINFQDEGISVFASHRLKSRWIINTKNMWLTPENLAKCFYDDVSLEYVADGRIRTLGSALSSLPHASHTFNSGTASDSWLMHNLSNPRTCTLTTSNIKTQVAADESPIVTLGDFGQHLQQTIKGLAVRSDYAEPVSPGEVTSDEVVICPELTDYVYRHYNFADGGISISTSFYYAYWESLILTYPLSHFVETTIAGLTTEPIVLHGYYSQTFSPAHHNFGEYFLFEPQLEPGISQVILEELRAQDIGLIYFVYNPSSQSSITTYADWEEPFLIADIDNSGKVDFSDFAVMGLRWLDSVCDECGGADLNNDGRVDFDDMLEISQQWLHEL